MSAATALATTAGIYLVAPSGFKMLIVLGVGIATFCLINVKTVLETFGDLAFLLTPHGD